jgi:hypothetical protein
VGLLLVVGFIISNLENGFLILYFSSLSSNVFLVVGCFKSTFAKTLPIMILFTVSTAFFCAVPLDDNLLIKFSAVLIFVIVLSL